MLIDLHVYTSPGGGRSLSSVVRDAKDAHLDAIVVADRAASAATAAALDEDGRVDGLPVFVGVELETRDGDVIIVTPEVDPFMSREEWRELTALDRPTMDEVRTVVDAIGGVILLAHPYDRNRGSAPRDRVFALAGPVAAEVGNDVADAVDNMVALEALSAGSTPVFGGSASKTSSGKRRWLTLFAGAIDSQSALVAALRSGDFWALESRADGERPASRERGGRRNDRGDRGGRGGRGGSGGDRGRRRSSGGRRNDG